MTSVISRRTLLSFTPLAATVALCSPTPAFAAPETGQGSTERGPWAQGASINGWPVITNAETYPVEGSNQNLRLANPLVAALLVHVARRYHYEIHQLSDGDLTSHITDRNVSQDFESTYLSGTAISIQVEQHPYGMSETFFPRQLRVIKDILGELDGTVVWGGNFTIPAPAHFHLIEPPQSLKLERVAIGLGFKSAPDREGNIGQPTLAAGD